jgi:hypothetical protein
MPRARRHLAQRALLVLGRLFIRGNPKVDRRSLVHVSPHACTALASTHLALFCRRFVVTISRRFSYSLNAALPPSVCFPADDPKPRNNGEDKGWAQRKMASHEGVVKFRLPLNRREAVALASTLAIAD